jgi:hypothetical protein
MASLLSLIILIITIFEFLIWYFTYFTLIGFHCWICDFWKGHISLFFHITYVSVLRFMHLKLSLIGVLNLPSSVISVEVLRILRQGWVVARCIISFQHWIVDVPQLSKCPSYKKNLVSFKMLLADVLKRICSHQYFIKLLNTYINGKRLERK